MSNLEQTILKGYKDAIDAFNNGNVKGLVSHYADDIVEVDYSGVVCNGKAELEASFDEVFKQMPGISMKYENENISIRMLTPELSVIRVPIELVLPGGNPALKGNHVLINKKEGELWLAIESHMKLYPPPME